eukprot:TRINITY_DN52_c3_g1_i1.p1 TRINITY_DN52_c3_g1~~TRINITY_DN52_c3_g1_i1.p1  ORF type:complete len:706 (+),score=285.03 TRINITY_DN52_c3_g1_i1:230-2347(+)
MNTSEAKYMKKKVTTGEIEADYDEFCILVNYEIEVTILGDSGEALMNEKKRDVKRIRLQSLNENSNTSLLAQEIIDKCKLIHVSKLPLVEALLNSLKEKKINDDRQVGQSLRPEGKANHRVQSPEEDPNVASMKKMEEYIELLYEDESAVKLKATKAILTLARKQDNLEDLLQDEQLFGVLSRMLRDEALKDLDLATDIVYIFFCFSNFSAFHTFLAQNRVGDSCMRIVEFELERCNKWRAQIEHGTAEGGKTGNAQVAKYTKMTNKYRPKQEQLLSVCCHLLLNLAEDITLERKMRKRNLVHNLATLLDWQSLELQVVILTFLKKLSVFKENKDDMVAAAESLVPRVCSFVKNSDQEALANTAVRLLLNLSFDVDLQHHIVKCGIIPRLVNMVGDDAARPVALKILYHLSMDDAHKPLFAETDISGMLLKLILETPADQFVSRETMSLAINLATEEENSARFAADGLSLLMLRVKKTGDPLLMKMLRAMPAHDGRCRDAFLPHLQDLLTMLKKSKSDDFMVEVIGCLSELSQPQIEWGHYVPQNGLVDYLAKILVPGYTEDDIVLEAVMLAGTITTDRKVAQLVAETTIIPSLVDILLQKQEDDEIVLQTIFVFFRLMQHRETRQYLLIKTQIVQYLLHLMFDKNPEIRRTSSSVLDIVMEYDKEWAKQIMAKRFQTHNPEWSDIVQAEDRGESYVPPGSPPRR